MDYLLINNNYYYTKNNYKNIETYSSFSKTIPANSSGNGKNLFANIRILYNISVKG